MISTRQMRCLVALAECGHFGRAAERCHITQPALSKQIQQMEELLGVLLVERTRRSVMLTPVGRDIAARSAAVLRDMEDIMDVARVSRAPLSGTIRVGVLPTLGPYLLPHILPRLRERHPDAKLYLREEPEDRLLAELDSGDLDFILISLDDGAAAERANLPLFFEPFWWVAPAASANAGMAGQGVLLLDEGHCLHQQVGQVVRKVGAHEEPSYRATSLDSLRQMVATGLGATLLPALYVAAEAAEDAQLAVRPFPEPPPGRSIGVVWRRTSPRGADCHLLAALVWESLPDVVRKTVAVPPR